MSVVSRLLGHGSTDVTEKVYARFLPETLSAEVARLDVYKRQDGYRALIACVTEGNAAKIVKVH